MPRSRSWSRDFQEEKAGVLVLQGGWQVLWQTGVGEGAQLGAALDAGGGIVIETHKGEPSFGRKMSFLASISLGPF